MFPYLVSQQASPFQIDHDPYRFYTPIYFYPITNSYSQHPRPVGFRAWDTRVAEVFRRAHKVANDYGFVGGIPTTMTVTGNGTSIRSEVIFIKPGYGRVGDLMDLPSEPVDFADHLRNVDRALRDDSRYLGGFPNFHRRAGRYYGAVRLYKNAGERRWVSKNELHIGDNYTDLRLMQEANRYARSKGFAGGFPSFEHRPDKFEIILLSNEAAEPWIMTTTNHDPGPITEIGN